MTMSEILDLQTELMLPNEMAIQSSLLDVERSLRVVDLGCGNGGYIKKIAELFPQHEYVLIDEGEYLIAEAKMRFEKYSNVEVLAKNIYDLKYKDEFDVVITRATLMYNTERLDKYFAIANKMLVKGGSIILLEPDDDLHLISEKFPIYTELLKNLHDIYGKARYLGRELPGYLEENGFKVNFFNVHIFNKYCSPDRDKFYTFIYLLFKMASELKADPKILEKAKYQIVEAEKSKGLDFAVGFVCVVGQKN